jgi:hypothetical protein
LSPVSYSRSTFFHLGQGGFSFIEVLVSLAITLVAMGVVFRTVQMMVAVYERESEIAEKSLAATQAFDDIVLELTRASYGLGEGVQAVLPYLQGGTGSRDGITIRSSLDGFAASLDRELFASEEPVPVSEATQFRTGDKVLLTQVGGVSERAEITEVTDETVAFRSMETADGHLVNSYSPGRGARAVKLSEIGYSVDPAPEGQEGLLKKHSFDRPPRVLARNVLSLRFEYLDAEGRSLSDESVERTTLLASVRVTMKFSIGPLPMDERTLVTVVAFDPQSASVDFAEPGYGLRLTRYFAPIEEPNGVATKPFADWGVILSSGRDASRDRPYLYTFMAEGRFLDTRTDNVTWLEDVRAPIALCFGPEKGPLAGSLFLAASGLRVGYLARIFPDEYGALSPESRVEVFEGTEALAQIGGIAFALDDALYITSQEKGAIFRFRFDEIGKASGPEMITEVSGSPRTIVLGANGALHFLLDKANESLIWRIAFDEANEPQEPELVGSLPGQAVSLAADSFSGSLFVLIRERLGDTVVFELDSRWLSDPSIEPLRVFSLSDFAEETMEGRSQDRAQEANRAASMTSSIRLPTLLLPETLDFLAFDNMGFLYLGAREKDLVLKFDLDRAKSSRHIVNVVGAVEGVDGNAAGRPRVRLQAWRRNRVGS